MEDNLPQGEEQLQEQNTLSPVQQEAVDAGWVPKEQFNGDIEKWVDAAEFLRRGELFKKIESQSRELKDVKRALTEMKKLHSEVREVEYKRALEALKAQKKAALEEGDADAVLNAEERIELVKEQQRVMQQEVAEAPQTSGEEHPEFVEWKNKNSWYTSNKAMKAFADTVGADFAAEGLTPQQVLKRVEQEVRKEFPQRFENPRQNRPSGVEAPTGRGKATAELQLSADEKKIMHTFVRTGVMTEQEYIAELKKVRGV